MMVVVVVVAVVVFLVGAFLNIVNFIWAVNRLVNTKEPFLDEDKDDEPQYGTKYSVGSRSGSSRSTSATPMADLWWRRTSLYPAPPMPYGEARFQQRLMVLAFFAIQFLA